MWWKPTDFFHLMSGTYISVPITRNCLFHICSLGTKSVTLVATMSVVSSQFSTFPESNFNQQYVDRSWRWRANLHISLDVITLKNYVAISILLGEIGSSWPKVTIGQAVPSFWNMVCVLQSSNFEHFSPETSKAEIQSKQSINQLIHIIFQSCVTKNN